MSDGAQPQPATPVQLCLENASAELNRLEGLTKDLKKSLGDVLAPETGEKTAEVPGQIEPQPACVMENKLNDLVYRLGVVNDRVSNILQRLRV